MLEDLCVILKLQFIKDKHQLKFGQVQALSFTQKM